MSERLIPTIARVECRSEGRGEETPTAVVIGSDRFEIIDVIDRATVTSIEAGGPIRHRLWVEIDDGRRCELTRVDPDGVWRVRIES